MWQNCNNHVIVCWNFHRKRIESYKLYVCNTWVSTALNYWYHTIDARGKLQSLTQWWWLRRWLWQWLMTSLLIPKRVCACFCVCKYHVCHCFFQPFPADLWPIQVRRWLPVHCVQCREHFGLRDHPPLTGWPVGRSQWVVHSVDMYKDGQAPGTSPTLWKKLKSRNTHIKNDHNSIREWYGIVLQNVKNGNRPNLLLNCWTGLARPQGTSKTTVKWMSVSAIWPALWNLNLQKWDHVSHLLLLLLFIAV